MFAPLRHPQRMSKQRSQSLTGRDESFWSPPVRMWCSIAYLLNPSSVIGGLDPAIYPLRLKSFCSMDASRTRACPSSAYQLSAASRVNPTCGVKPGHDEGDSECWNELSSVRQPVLLPQPPRRLHPLHAVAGEMAPDDGVAHELVGAPIEDAGAGMEVEIELSHLLDHVGREIHGEPRVRRVHLVVVLPGNPHHE